MNPRAIAALLSTAGEATQVFDELKAAGFGRVEVSAVEENLPALDGAQGVYDVAREASPPSDPSTAPFFRKHDSPASSFTDELQSLGFSSADARHFVDGLTSGGSLVTVDATPNPERAREILSRFDADVREAGGSNEPVASADQSGTQRLELRGERLDVDKRLVRHGQATVRKEVVTEMRTIEVPVSREELVIVREPAEPNAGSSEPLGNSEEIRIPLSEERVSVEKQAVVLEEVAIGKRRVQETQQITDTVRHEELRVERPDESA
ncbi:MAG: YsnF/AvaK domain-containing protein [Candidatus Eremiobacteraeota bacterium]|nr:YsnF/AvaK domain-containing protein [Candidatus Eremiobacteraeota bacterium]